MLLDGLQGSDFVLGVLLFDLLHDPSSDVVMFMGFVVLFVLLLLALVPLSFSPGELPFLEELSLDLLGLQVVLSLE